MSAVLRSQGHIVLNVASSGIAALLLEGRRTGHSRVAVPINIHEDSMCHIPTDSDLADLIHQAKLIIWDEAPMIQSYCYEAFDRTLRNIWEERLYQSSDYVFLADDDTNFNESIYTTNFLNGIKMSGLPKHATSVKDGNKCNQRKDHIGRKCGQDLPNPTYGNYTN
ncbi:ATP-dependent DNA helicase PIF1-like protein [Tanacetum coccineum]